MFTYSRFGAARRALTPVMKFAATFMAVGAMMLLLSASAVAASYTFSNPAAISLPDNPAPGSPYPSTITASGVTGSIGKITVSISQYQTQFWHDTHLLLVGPGGEQAYIMAEWPWGSGGSAVDITFDDAAATPGGSGLAASGTYTPVRYPYPYILPAPAPAPTGNSALSVFNGTSANGTWSLYSGDSTSGGSGSIAGGWSLTITEDPGPLKNTHPRKSTLTPDRHRAFSSHGATVRSNFQGRFSAALPRFGPFWGAFRGGSTHWTHLALSSAA